MMPNNSRQRTALRAAADAGRYPDRAVGEGEVGALAQKGGTSRMKAMWRVLCVLLIAPLGATADDGVFRGEGGAVVPPQTAHVRS
jgi:hypothetical protein